MYSRSQSASGLRLALSASRTSGLTTGRLTRAESGRLTAAVILAAVASSDARKSQCTPASPARLCRIRAPTVPSR